MRADIWSDIVCPWCYVGKARFEKALSGFAHRDEVEVVYHSFELDPGYPADKRGETNLQMLERKFAMSAAQARGADGQVAALAHAEGLGFEVERPIGNTFDLHRVIHLGLAKGVQRELLSLLWEGKLQEGLAYLDSRRDEMKSSKAIDDLKSYLERRAAYLPNYSVRREAGLWIASNRVEKLNDATVSDRCKGRGMAWTPAGVLSLARLEAADCNGEIDCWTWQRELPHWHAAPALAA